MSLNSRTKIIPREIKKGEQSKATVHSNTHTHSAQPRLLLFFYFIFFFIRSGLNVWENWHKSSAATEWRRRRKRLGSSGGRSYLRLHGSVHGRCVGRRAAVGERFRGAGRQRGLLGRRGGLRGALNVLTVALVGLRWRNCRGWGEKGMSIREKLILWSLGKLLHLTNNDQQHTAGDNDIKHAWSQLWAAIQTDTCADVGGEGLFQTSQDLSMQWGEKIAVNDAGRRHCFGAPAC